jgi:succinate-semialdehyde dehydrogenase/glutarate-semialdehyde dehydrogenase
MMSNQLVLLSDKLAFSVVNGQRVAESGAGLIEVSNPATGELVARVVAAGAKETQEAIEAARDAQILWKAQTATQRSKLLERWFDLIELHTDELARLMVLEQGKPLAEAIGEIAYAANFVKFFAEEAKRIYGETIPSTSKDKRNIVIREPVGVCAAITPWNFPAAMVTRKAAPALAAGCTMVIKPSELTPLTALKLVELAQDAGIPDGVLNVVVGDATEIGGVLTSSCVVRMLSFTGSTRVGQLLMAQSAPTIKKLGLELGGNAPFIVFDDANLDVAVEGAIASKFRNSGQTCVCANRLYVQAGVYDAFAAKLVERVKSLKTGFGLEAGVTQGPLINEPARKKALAHIADAVSHGAQVVTGGRALEGPGFFMEPTVITGVTHQMLCMREETFGPVAPLVRFETEQEVIELANSTEFGLASYFFSQDVTRCFRVAEAIESGMVGVNTGLISSEVVPFGGVKQSGLGREGSHHGLEEYTELKFVCFGSIG